MRQAALLCRARSGWNWANRRCDSASGAQYMGAQARCPYEKWGRYRYRPHSRRRVASILGSTTWHPACRRFCRKGGSEPVARRSRRHPVSSGDGPSGLNRGFAPVVPDRLAITETVPSLALRRDRTVLPKQGSVDPLFLPGLRADRSRPFPPGDPVPVRIPLRKAVRCRSLARPECPAVAIRSGSEEPFLPGPRASTKPFEFRVLPRPSESFSSLRHLQAAPGMRFAQYVQARLIHFPPISRWTRVDKLSHPRTGQRASRFASSFKRRALRLMKPAASRWS